MALTQKQKLVLGGGALGAVALLFYFRKPAAQAARSAVTTVTTAVTTAISDAERAVLRQFAAGGQESYIDASFNIGLAEGLSPYLLLGHLAMESGFGRYLTHGQAFGHDVYTGDFIPRPATKALDAHMAKYPLPGAKRVYWERPKIGNLAAYSGDMWVPAYDLRMQAAGGNVSAAYAANKGVSGGVGWGFTPWQLDWVAFAPDLTAGAAWDPGKATKTATKLMKSNIATLKRAGLTGPSLVAGVIAAYNAGAGKVVNAVKAGTPLTQVTADASYVDKVMSVANAVGKSINIV